WGGGRRVPHSSIPRPCGPSWPARLPFYGAAGRPPTLDLARGARRGAALLERFGMEEARRLLDAIDDPRPRLLQRIADDVHPPVADRRDFRPGRVAGQTLEQGPVLGRGQDHLG